MEEIALELQVPVIETTNDQGHAPAPSPVLILEQETSDVETKSFFSFPCKPELWGKSQATFESASKQNYLQGCKWAPDGSCLMTNSEDHKIRLYNLPSEVDNKELLPVLVMKECEQIYDFHWFPLMNSSRPETCLLGTTSGHAPIHLWDAYTGTIRATYKAYNAADEMTAARCLAFSPDGSKIYTGFEKVIRIFDTSLPGRLYVERPTYHGKQGQYGILSCIAVSPKEALYAVGAYSKQISLYDDRLGTSICDFQGHKGGVTHLAFSPDGAKLYSGGRKDDEILCWDIRKLDQILTVMHRDVKTNQRIYFDIDVNGKFVASGNTNGKVTFWATDDYPDEVEKPVEAIFSFDAHDDCVNGVSLHPTLPVISTTSGQRSFPDVADDEDSLFVKSAHKPENTLKLWLMQPLESHSDVIDDVEPLKAV